jgi:hypothetical protein
MTPWLRGLVLLFPLLAAHVAAEDGTSERDGVKWRCWYDQDVHIICLIDNISDVQMMENLPTPIPSIAQEMRRDYGPGRKFFVHIPLHTHPGDVGFTAELARTTMCGSRADCTVDFSMEPPSDDEVDAMFGQGLPVTEPNRKPDGPPLSNTASPSN